MKSSGVSFTSPAQEHSADFILILSASIILFGLDIPVALHMEQQAPKDALRLLLSPTTREKWEAMYIMYIGFRV